MGVKRLLGGRRVCLFDGIAGGILSAGQYLDRQGLDLFEGGRFAQLSRYICGKNTGNLEVYLQLLLSPAAYRRFAPEAGYARVEQELRRHADAPNPVTSFIFWNWTRRRIALAPFQILRPHTVLAPYLDHDVFDLLAALPASLLLDGEFHNDAIRRAHPRHADLPFARQHYNRQENRPHFRRFAHDLIGRAMKRGSLSPLRVSRVGPALLAAASTGRRTWWLRHALYAFQLDQMAATGSARRF